MSEPITIRCPHCGRVYLQTQNTGAQTSYIVHHTACGKFFRVTINGKDVKTEKI